MIIIIIIITITITITITTIFTIATITGPVWSDHEYRVTQSQGDLCASGGTNTTVTPL
jgi:hypothetical protein